MLERERKALRLVRSGLPLAEAAKRSGLPIARIRKALRLENSLSETEHEGETNMTTEKVRKLAEGIKAGAERQGIDLQEYAAAARLAADMGRDTEARVAERAEQLRREDDPYYSRAYAEAFDKGEIPMAEPAAPIRQSQNAARLAERDRKALRVKLGEASETPDAATIKIRKRANERNISEAQAEQELFDEGVIR